MRISDWSSDVCSSDLRELPHDYAVLAVDDVGAFIFDRENIGAGEDAAHRALLAPALIDAAGRARVAVIPGIVDHARSEESRVGTECVSTCRYRGVQYDEKQKTTTRKITNPDYT